jgi:hypothetical protein
MSPLPVLSGCHYMPVWAIYDRVEGGCKGKLYWLIIFKMGRKRHSGTELF